MDPEDIVEGVIGPDRRSGGTRDITIPLDENGNVMLYRSTDDPNRIIDSNFLKKRGDHGSSGLGQHNYFSPNPMYSDKYQRPGTHKNYKFVTEIKLNEILDLDTKIGDRPDLAKALGIPESVTFDYPVQGKYGGRVTEANLWDMNWRQAVGEPPFQKAMGFPMGHDITLQKLFGDNIDLLKENGVKALGTGATGKAGVSEYVEYEIIPLVKEGDTLGIKPVSIMDPGSTAGKTLDVFTEIPLDTPTNVVDDLTPNQLADNFFNSLNRDTKGNVELYVKHAGGKVSANEITFSHKLGGGNHIPGFYTEPIGNKTLEQIRGPGHYGDAADNFYKVQVNTDNLLINIKEGEFRGRDIFYPKSNVGGAAPLMDQIEKIDWDIFAKETGVSFDDLVESTKNSTISFSYDNAGRRVYGGGSEVFTKVLAEEVGDTELAFTALRKAGIEGFVSGPTNAQYEVVLLDPNDDLGIGKRINIEDTTVEQFKTSKATANPIDEIIIDTPTNVVDKAPDTPESLFEFPDTVPQELVDEADMERFIEFNELQEMGDTMYYDAADRAESVMDNMSSQLSDSEGERLFELVESYDRNMSALTNNLRLGKIAKRRIINKAKLLMTRLLTPGMEYLDIYETGVFLLGGLIAAAPELKPMAEHYGSRMAHNMAKQHGVDLPLEEYTPDWENIALVLDQVESVSPTDLLIKKAAAVDTDTGYKSAYLPPLSNPQPIIDMNVSFKNTVSNYKNLNKYRNADMSDSWRDKMVESFKHGSTK